jgi:hypothetical protein
MNTYIVYVHWCSDHVFTAGVNAHQPQVKQSLACMSTLKRKSSDIRLAQSVWRSTINRSLRDRIPTGLLFLGKNVSDTQAFY